MNNREGRSEEIEELADRIIPISCDGGVIEASVFGSFARGEAQLDSDLDLLVRLKTTFHYSMCAAKTSDPEKHLWFHIVAEFPRRSIIIFKNMSQEQI